MPPTLSSSRRRQRHLADIVLVSGIALFLLGARLLLEAPPSRSPTTPLPNHARKPHAVQPKPTPSHCRATRAGMETVTDSNGYVCPRASKSPANNCCPSTSARYTCDSCHLPARCCASYEHCVSCCMAPSHGDIRVPGLAALGLPRDPDEVEDVFVVCKAACRSSSKSVVHENAYRHAQHHCFGRAAPSFDPELHRGVFDFAKPLARG